MECDNCHEHPETNPPKLEYEGLLLCEKCFLELFDEIFTTGEKAYLIGARVVCDAAETLDWS